MSMQQDQLVERIEQILTKQERLSMGEIEILRGIISRETALLSFMEENEIRQIEKKIGMA